jgi:hypothetical protein
VLVAVSVVATAAVSIPTTLLIDNAIHQAAANQAADQAQQDAAAAALRHDAELVDFGLKTPSRSISQKIVIENRSSGWVRNLTLVVPVPVPKTPEAGGDVSISIPNFNVYQGVGGFQGVWYTVKGGATFREPLPDIPSCFRAVTTVLRSLPGLDPTTMATAQIDFTDPNGIAWRRFGSGELVRNRAFKGPGAWTPYMLLEPMPGCSPG